MKKGIALATLVVIISVMLILVSVITVTGFNTSNTTRKLVFASELKMVQDSVNSYRTLNNGELPAFDFVVIDLSEASDFVLNQFEQNGEDIVDDRVSLNKIDFNKLEVKNLTRGINETYDDVYVVSTKTGIVYYAKGLKIGSKTYYTLIDELKNLVSYNAKSSEQKTEDTVIFEPSTTEWLEAGVPVVLKVKVPKKFTLTNILCSDPSNAMMNISNTSSEKYNEYTFDVVNNSLISVNYKNEKNENKTDTFEVKNLDRDIPQVSVESINTIGDKKYIKLNCSDGTSGIKYLKYDEGELFFNREIFKNNGYDIKDDMIEVNSDVQSITIYIEDNAGNNTAYEVNL